MIALQRIYNNTNTIIFKVVELNIYIIIVRGSHAKLNSFFIKAEANNVLLKLKA